MTVHRDDYRPIIAAVDEHSALEARAADLQAMLDAINRGARAFLGVDGSTSMPLEVKQSTAAEIIQLARVDEAAKLDELRQKLQRKKGEAR